PLTAIKGWAETLQTVGDSDPALMKRGMEVIIDEASRLTGVVEDLLDLSKIVNGRMTLRYEKIDILAELDDTIFVFKDRSMREGIELIYNVPHVPAPAEGDPNRINQVFVNILDNAFKYTEQGGKITVFAEMLPPEGEEEKSTLRVFVEDTGCGISKEELPKVRKKFYKSNISVRGSGIGLAVVDEIVKMHGGTMEIQSEVGVGTCVILSFPVDTVPVENVPLESLADVPEVETETTEVE
ncbi:MAG: HAMP domain-containing sensor histidine kinase, partial [Acutalibacteraceae bacterium]|nr:HAMP domain-containing sensor histidine kinase [Acutalibacteraceae bacterium]